MRNVCLALGVMLLSTTALTAAADASTYQVNAEISNQRNLARRYDQSTINPWGLDAMPDSPLQVNMAGGHKSATFKRPTFHQEGKIRTEENPTGIVVIPANAHGAADFNITEGSNSAPALMAVVTEGGLLQGWNPNVDTVRAVTALDRSAASSRFTGLAMLPVSRKLLLADFANGFVEEFDGSFNQIGQYTDTTLPPNYAPYNVRLLAGRIYVAFAQKDPATGKEVAGAGLGYIDVFDDQGNFVQQLVANGALDAPWGMTMAPKNFGQFAGDLLVANWGDGKINAFDPGSGQLMGTLSNTSGNPFVFEGLHGLRTGPGNAITFTSGPNGGTNGLVGTITLVSE